MHSTPIILASGSPRRQQLLRGMGVTFEVRVPRVDEVHWLERPQETVLENARRKCESMVAATPEACVIAADTVVAFQGHSIGKPRDMAEARNFLQRFSGHHQEVYTGLALACPGQPMRIEAVCSMVYFRTLDDAAITSYHDVVDPLDKAGGYNIDEHGELIIDHYDGSHSNIMGLPVRLLTAWLTEAGLRHD